MLFSILTSPSRTICSDLISCFTTDVSMISFAETSFEPVIVSVKSPPTVSVKSLLDDKDKSFEDEISISPLSFVISNDAVSGVPCIDNDTLSSETDKSVNNLSDVSNS